MGGWSVDLEDPHRRGGTPQAGGIEAGAEQDELVHAIADGGCARIVGVTHSKCDVGVQSAPHTVGYAKCDVGRTRVGQDGSQRGVFDEMTRVGVVEEATGRWSQRFRGALGGVELGGQTRRAVKTPVVYINRLATPWCRNHHAFDATESTGSSVRSNSMADSWTSGPGGIDLHLDLPPGRGRRSALEGALRQAIRDGRLAPGEWLPSSRALAAQLGLARGTVVEVYSQLAAEGYLRTRPGAATEVARGPHVPTRVAVEPVAAPVVADFRLGRPDISMFPRAEWLRALRRALQTTAHSELGPADPRGSPRLRALLANYLGRVRGVLTTSERIVICSGFTQGLRLVCDALATGGARSIALENPCLPDHRAIADASGLAVVPLDVDRSGARPEGFTKAAAAAVLTPAHQAPLGATLDPARRTEFARIAATRGVYLVEDDYDGEFRYDRHPVGALQGLAPEHVIYAGSASKSLAPGLRLGWLALPNDLVDAVIEAKRRADRGTDVLAQLAFAELIESGALDRHIRRMRRRYGNRRDALIATLGRYAPAVSIHGIAAGLHAVVSLPEHISEADVIAAAQQRKVALTGLAPFWHGTGQHTEGIVIGYGTPLEHEYAAALAHLGQLMSAVTKK